MKCLAVLVVGDVFRFFFFVKMGRNGLSFPKTSIKNLFLTSQVGAFWPMFFFFFGAWLSWLWPFLRKAVDCLHARYLQKSQANMVACAVHPGIIGTGLGGVIKTWDGVEINIDALEDSRDFA